MNNRVSAIVAGEVRAYLARRRLSARQAAIKLGWTAPYLSRRLTGEVPFDVADLAAIAELLEVPVTVFFEPPKEIRTPGFCRPAALARLAVAA